MTPMSDGLGPDETKLLSQALQQALDRLKSLGLISGDEDRANSVLRTLMLQAMGSGQRDQESLVLFAIGRFQQKEGKMR
jgi:hypothetical protein